MSQFITINDRFSYLYALERKGIKVGLSHTKELLARCGNPHVSFPSIHIAGTNGKGSTSAMIDSILRTAGYKVGLYTSPHLIRFNERVRVNGIPISDEDIIQFIDQYHQDFENIDSTFFETTTSLAFWCFSKQKVDIAIIETGLGGRLDSTNVITPKISVITPVDKDHKEILGSDIREIAREKAGIIKKGVPLVLAMQSPKVKETILEIARKMKSQVYNLEEPSDITVSKTETSFQWDSKNFKTSLIGSYQAQNAALAMKTVSLFDNRITRTQMREALNRVVWPGRMQVMSSSPWILYDVAHNAHGLINVLDSIRQMSNQKPLGVISIKEDKDIADIADVIRNKFEHLIVTSDSNVGVMSAELLEDGLRLHDIHANKIKSMEKAVAWLKTHLKENQLGLIFGSHYIGKATFNAFEFSFDRGAI
ncbi:MAG: bifunctional folylpolyglutamate synthase/dihydrofolate synthase [Candidatus Marinimicrobia bacterium]|nr:bifunctional folylpolyglutamate synthase/dihydrofolate synthase [Candidatus Neomarinimicrobiota bacterium]